MATYTLRNATTTNTVSRSYTSGVVNDTYARGRFYTSFDLTAVSSPANVNGPTADGTIIETYTVPHGDPPNPES